MHRVTGESGIGTDLELEIRPPSKSAASSPVTTWQESVGKLKSDWTVDVTSGDDDIAGDSSPAFEFELHAGTTEKANKKIPQTHFLLFISNLLHPGEISVIGKDQDNVRFFEVKLNPIRPTCFSRRPSCLQ